MCCKRSYGPHDLEPFLPSLWRVLSKEIFLGANESINSEILQLITAVFETLSKSEAVLNAWVTMVFNGKEQPSFFLFLIFPFQAVSFYFIFPLCRMQAPFNGARVKAHAARVFDTTVRCHGLGVCMLSDCYTCAATFIRPVSC